MKFHSHWFGAYVPVDTSIAQLADALTLKSCEVEEFVNYDIPALVVIGKVLDVYKHPNADTLFVVQLDCGAHGRYQICTGGENVTLNSYVPVALPGCYLPVIDLQIGARKMRGEDSNGMICSKRELGFDREYEDHRIWTLQLSKHPTDYALLPQERLAYQGEFSDITDKDCGKALVEKYPRMRRSVLEVDNKTLTHRPDLFGHDGLCSELSAIYSHKQFTLADMNSNYDKGISVAIETDLCSSYTAVRGQIISTYRDGATAFRDRMILGDLGIDPRQARVNRGNLFMYEHGQPIHIFDADGIVGSIVVRQAVSGESFTDLTGKTHTLESSDIVIADETKVLALAGIIGGLACAYSDSTTQVVIEIAHFDPVQVRKTGMRLGIRTDAQQRYEKHIHPLWTQYCAQLVAQQVSEGMLNQVTMTKVVPHPHVSTTIQVDLERVRRIIYGDTASLDEQDFWNVLGALGIEHTGTTAQIPVWRGPADLTIEDDLIEEYIRICGYEQFPGQQMEGTVRIVAPSLEMRRQRYLEDLMIGQQYDQVETYPWIDEQRIQLMGINPRSCVLLANPIDSNRPYLRPTMLRSMLDIVLHNTHHHMQMRLFDIGKVWQDDTEYTTLSVLIAGEWSDEVTGHPLLYLKSLLKKIAPQLDTFKPLSYTRSHPKQAMEVWYQERVIGRIATLHPMMLSEYGIKEGIQVCYMELQLDQLGETILPHHTAGYRTNETALVYKQLSVLVASDTDSSAITSIALAYPQVQSCTVRDLYTNSTMQDQKSITLDIAFDTTGSDEEVTDMLRAVVELYKQACIEIRGV